jgi:hypothetical protein
MSQGFVPIAIARRLTAQSGLGLKHRDQLNMSQGFVPIAAARRLTAQSGLTPQKDKTLCLQIREAPGGMLGFFDVCFLGESAIFLTQIMQ